MNEFLLPTRQLQLVPDTNSTFQELLFCETCDTVFCTLCTGGSHMRDDNETIDVTDGGKQQFGMELTFLVQTKIFLIID